MAANTSWVDFTLICKDAAAELSERNPIVFTESFSLLDSMSAIEIMDPKTDQSHGYSGTIDINEIIRAKMPSSLSLQELIPVLKFMIVNLAGYLDGASLVESTHQCLLAWEQSWSFISDDLVARVIRFFGQHYLNSISAYSSFITRLDIFEDEDFQFSNSLILPRFEIDPNLSNELTEQINARLSQEDSKILVALLMIQSTLSSFFDTLSVMSELPFLSRRGERLNESSSKEFHITLVAFSSKITKFLEACSQLNLDENSVDISDVDSSTIEVFHQTLLPKLFHHGPMRVIQFKSFSESIAHLSKTLLQVHTVCNPLTSLLTNAKEEANNFSALLHYLINISSKKLHLLTRSIHFLLIHQVRATLLSSVKQSIRGVDHLTNDSDLPRLFSDNLLLVCWDTIKHFHVNFNRLFSRFDAIFSSWGSIIAEAASLDKSADPDTKQQSLLFWSISVTSQLMDFYMSLMMESKLLSLDEYDQFFWYWDYLISSRIFANEKLQQQQLESRTVLFESQIAAEIKIRKDEMIKTIKGSRNIKLIKKINSPEEYDRIASEVVKDFERKGIFRPAPSPVAVDDLVLKGRGQLCRGLFRICVINAKNVTNSESIHHYSSPNARFEKRFKSFQSIPSPAVLTYSEFSSTLSNSRDSEESSSKIAQGAQICFQNAKKLFDEARKRSSPASSQAEHITGLTKVAISNSLQCNKLLKVVADQQQSGNIIALNHSYDSHFPNIEVICK